MFDNDYTINGKHATYIKYLVNEAKVFTRYIDVYMNAAVLGFLHGRQEKKDSASQDRARIYADAFANERLYCDFIYRMIMLLDDTSNLTATQQVDRAFRNDSKKANEEDKAIHIQNLDLFNAYVLGGIEELYEQFSGGSTNRVDYINKIFDITTSFKEEIEGIDYDSKLIELVTV